MEEILKDFDPLVAKESIQVMKLQDLILTANIGNMAKNAKIISDLLISKQITPLDISYCVYTIERYNSLTVKTISRLITEIGKIIQSKSEEIFKQLKVEILERIFFPLVFFSTSHILLYYLLKYGFYDESEIWPHLANLKNLIYLDHYHQYIYPFLIWFAPLIDKLSPDYFKVVNSEKKQFSNKKYEPLFFDIRQILSFDEQIHFNEYYREHFLCDQVYNQLKADNWKLHTFVCEHGYFPDSIEEVIANDDLETFIELMKESSISYKTRISYNLFAFSHVINSSTSLIEYAAFCSSVKIFRYLINTVERENREYLGANVHHMSTAPYLAVYSGCLEILQICDEYNVNMYTAIYCAACFYKHEILHWLIEQKNVDINQYSHNFLYPIHQSASSNNIRGLLYLIWKGSNVLHDNPDLRVPYPVVFGLEFNRYHTVKLLLHYKPYQALISNQDFLYGYAFILKVFISCDINLFNLVESILPDGINLYTIVRNPVFLEYINIMFDMDVFRKAISHAPKELYLQFFFSMYCSTIRSSR